jgi:hypothetical protein
VDRGGGRKPSIAGRLKSQEGEVRVCEGSIEGAGID